MKCQDISFKNGATNLTNQTNDNEADKLENMENEHRSKIKYMYIYTLDLYIDLITYGYVLDLLDVFEYNSGVFLVI